MSEKYGFFARAWRNFAEAVTSSPVASIIAAGVLQLFAPFFPLFNIVSNAVIALISFHYANRRVIVVACAAVLALVCAASLILFGAHSYGILWLLENCSWLPILFITSFWARHSITTAWQLLAVLALCGLVLIHLTVHDLTAMWESVVYDFLPMDRAAMPEEMALLIGTVTERMTGTFTAGLIAFWIYSSLLGRWMQLLLTARGLFRDEVANFRMGAILTAVLVAAAVMWSLDEQAHPIWGDIVYVLSVFFLLQGVITAHQLIVIFNEEPLSWLMGLYIALGVSMLVHPIVWVIMIVLGALENLVKFKHRCRLLKESSS